MPILLTVRAALLMLVMLGAEIDAAQLVPAVYRDEYVTIHAGVAEIGLRPIHIGDAVSFVVRLKFDASRVRVESLDSNFFERAFASQGIIKSYAPPVVTHEDRDDGQILMRASWPFQILGCPEDLVNCPGEKNYELPIMSISYQIIDETGNVLNDKTVRFRPWPGKIAVAPALANLNAPSGHFSEHFPGGAHPEVQAVERRNGAGIASIITGMLLLTVAFNSGLLLKNSRARSVHSPLPANRWQHVLSCLQNDSTPDEQWADLMRRCASWYCLDELNRNPHTPLDTDFDRFYAEILGQESIEAERRDEYLSRFIQLAVPEEDA